MRKLGGGPVQTHVVGGGGLGNQTEITLKALENGGLLDLPFTAVTKEFVVGDAWDEGYQSMI